jgi:hypothetical protein
MTGPDTTTPAPWEAPHGRCSSIEPAPSDGTALATLLDAAILVTIAATRWHQFRCHAQQALLHLRAAFD